MRAGKIDAAPHQHDPPQGARNVGCSHRCLACWARVMADTLLENAKVPSARLRHQFCIHEEIVTFDHYFLEDLPAKQLECAVDIAHSDTEDDPDEAVVYPRKYGAQHSVVAIDAKADDHVTLSDQRKKML